MVDREAWGGGAKLWETSMKSTLFAMWRVLSSCACCSGSLHTAARRPARLPETDPVALERGIGVA